MKLQRKSLSMHDPKKYTLSCSAPSTLGVPLSIGEPYPLILACVNMELGRDTEEGDWDPRRSSGSRRSCPMRSTPSCDTWGLAGKRSDLRQFRIICRVTCLCKTRPSINNLSTREKKGTDGVANEWRVPHSQATDIRE
jgi:hypothetical protein